MFLAATPARSGAEPVEPPLTPLAVKAGLLLDAVAQPHVRNHSLRSYFFARAVAEQQHLACDDELVFLICALHDIGMTDVANGDQRFEIDGADYAARFLEDNGVTDARVDLIWDAIAAHTSGFILSPVYQRRRPPEIQVAVTGIGIDLGGSASDLPPGYADRVHAAYPRLGGSAALFRTIEQQGLANPRKAGPATFAGEIVRQRHPEAPRETVEDILAASGWADS
ncbi:HD domain-containing protein [Nocardia yunnanensis]|uniref:HD domain-containing protein n=2 Tax=Nocardia yunnanensis TaxID=2382165 RepID=A0A386ZLM6_9NOCA|nr:HD domain-containing protein [Nocardia yunnanensis]